MTRGSIIALGWAIRHPGKALYLALWERRNRRAATGADWQTYRRETDARRVLWALERDGGGMFTVADIAEATRGTMTRTRILAALDALTEDGSVFTRREVLYGGPAGQVSVMTYGATEFDVAERERRAARDRVRHDK
jgi:hypothetical protein